MKLRLSFAPAEQDFSRPQFARMSEATRLVALEQLARLESKQKRAKENRRTSQRVEIRGEAELIAVEQHQMPNNVSVQLRDVCWTGVGFICCVPLPENSHWRICFVKDGVQVAQQTLIIRFSKEVNDGIHFVGGQFVLEFGVLPFLGVHPDEL